MRRGGVRWVLFALLSCGACSLRSLDHLGGDAGGDAGGGSGTSGASGGTPSNTGGGGTSGSQAPIGGSESAGSAGTPAAAGAPPEIPDCTDNERTADETDTDCGGRTCAPCDDHQRCLTGTDCASAICTNQVCQPPTCVDLAVNGNETDLNCGGTCPKCAQGQHCTVDADCMTGKCGDEACYSPACSDDVLQDGCPLLIDNTPYSLSPEHAPDKCIDDPGLSVAEGTGMVLYACKPEPHQTFWTVAREDGYFALRNALSGQCLQLRAASTEAGAVVEQATCDYSPQQLWKPERLDDQYMRLRSKLSELVLDVAGDNVASNLQPIVQGNQTARADTHWRVQKRTSGAYVALLPNADHSLHVSHDDALTTVSAADDDESSHWRVVPGLSDPSGVSFQSRDDPGRYLRHAGFRVWTDTNDGTDLFKQDATFRYTQPLVGNAAPSHGIESTNYPGLFMLRDADVIRLAKFVDSAEYRAAATWWLSPR